MGLSRLMPYIAMAILALVYFASVADAKPKSKSYYEILGVEQDCDAKDIKRAYHKLALKVQRLFSLLRLLVRATVLYYRYSYPLKKRQISILVPIFS